MTGVIKASDIYNMCMLENEGSLVTAMGDSYCIAEARKVDPAFSPVKMQTLAPEPKKNRIGVIATIMILLLIAAVIYFFFLKK